MKYFFSFGFLFFYAFCLSAQVAIQTNSTNVSCFGGNNGTINATATGGMQPYAYLWSTGEQSNTISSLPMGTYTITVTDAVANTASKTVIITQPPLLGATLNGQPQICTVAPDGFSYAIPTGGTPPCTYSWSNGAQTQLNNHLTANTYTATITDTRGCTTVGSFTVGYLGLGLYLFQDSEAATCPQPNNGAASVDVLSGNGPYQYLWSNGGTTPDISNLTAGDYSVTVSDINGCSAASTVTVERDDVDSTTIQIIIPQCTQEIYGFESSDGYHVYDWKLNDVRDSIIAGIGTAQIQVKWSVPGQKELTVAMSDTITQCATGTIFNVTVYVCATGTSTTKLNHFQVSPNPFEAFIAIHGDDLESQGSQVQLFNLQGKLLVQQMMAGQSTLLDTQGLTPGIYLLKVSDGTTNKVWKMVKS
jgi:SprB repeat/Secretion system C-terminal sorting domain